MSLRPDTERRLRLVAAVYRDALRAGEPPTAAVAAEFEVSHSHAANLVAKARRWGLLAPTTRGRVSALVDIRGS